MGGFPKFCGVIRFILLGFVLIMFACAAAFQFLPQELLQDYYAENNLTQSFCVTLYLSYGFTLLVPCVIAFIIHGVSHKKWKRVLKCKKEIGYVFDDIFDRMERAYGTQTYTRIYYTWKNPKKRGHDFILQVIVDVPSSYVNSTSLDAVMKDFKLYVTDYYHDELAPYGFEWYVKIK